MFRFACLILALLPTPALASDFLLAHDHGKLVLLSPCNTVHESLEPLYGWEGGMSCFECWYSGRDLVLYLHRDWAGTAWWYDLRLTQRPDGTVSVCWSCTGNPGDVVFARFASLRDAFHDPRVWRALEPALCEMGQYVPDVETAWGLIDEGW